jgi:hypothetical protein
MTMIEAAGKRDRVGELRVELKVKGKRRDHKTQQNR